MESHCSRLKTMALVVNINKYGHFPIINKKIIHRFIIIFFCSADIKISLELYFSFHHIIIILFYKIHKNKTKPKLYNI